MANSKKECEALMISSNKYIAPFWESPFCLIYVTEKQGDPQAGWMAARWSVARVFPPVPSKTKSSRP